MANTTAQNIFFLDDDPQLRMVVKRILEGVNIPVSCFDDPATCISMVRTGRCSLLITDLKMPETNGLEVLREVRRLAPWVPVLLISGYGDIPTAVSAIKAGAVDFIEKPLNKAAFIRKIKSMLAEVSPADEYEGKPLTQAEATVLGFVIRGKTSKEIARSLHRSTRTIEGHRSHLMRKLKADNILDLLKRVAAMGLADITSGPRLASATRTLSSANDESRLIED